MRCAASRVPSLWHSISKPVLHRIDNDDIVRFEEGPDKCKTRSRSIVYALRKKSQKKFTFEIFNYLRVLQNFVCVIFSVTIQEEGRGVRDKGRGRRGIGGEVREEG